jgi:hypothetical protein
MPTLRLVRQRGMPCQTRRQHNSSNSTTPSRARLCGRNSQLTRSPSSIGRGTAERCSRTSTKRSSVAGCAGAIVVSATVIVLSFIFLQSCLCTTSLHRWQLCVILGDRFRHSPRLAIIWRSRGYFTWIRRRTCPFHRRAFFSPVKRSLPIPSVPTSNSPIPR